MPDHCPHTIKTKPRIPVEVCERIIGFIFTNDYSQVPISLSTLSRCSYVCRDWRPRAQKILFEFVTLRDKDGLYRFRELLDKSPELGGYVRTLELRGYLHVPFSPAVLLPTVLRGMLPNLQELYILEVTTQKSAVNPLPKGKKEFPSLPIHPRYPSLVTSFSHIRRLNLAYISFPSFGDFARFLNALSNLESLVCYAVSWAVLGREPLCLAKHRLEGSRNNFLPNLQVLLYYDMDGQCGQRLISALGPSLQELWLIFPNTPRSRSSPHRKERPEDSKASDTPHPFDLKSIPNLRRLKICFAPLPRETHLVIQSLRDTLASWITSGDGALSDASVLRQRYVLLQPRWRGRFTRASFARILRILGPVMEDALCVNQALHDVRDSEEEEPGSQVNPCAVRLLVSDLGDRIEWKTWWEEQARACFPTFAKWSQLTVSVNTGETQHHWKDYERTPKDQPEDIARPQFASGGRATQEHDTRKT